MGIKLEPQTWTTCPSACKYEADRLSFAGFSKHLSVSTIIILIIQNKPSHRPFYSTGLLFEQIMLLVPFQGGWETLK